MDGLYENGVEDQKVSQKHLYVYVHMVYLFKFPIEHIGHVDNQCKIYQLKTYIPC